VGLLWLVAAAGAQTKPVDYLREVRPILASKCFQCHGPDDKVRKAGLRLDIGEEAVKELKSGNHAIVPGDLAKSTLVQRITAKEENEVMPPVKFNKKLEPREVDILQRWVKEGGKYAAHWSLVKATAPKLPEVKDKTWAKNPIDVFILARLESEGLKPTAAADRYTLARRLALDLTGLPPTPEMVDAFVSDKAPNAYEKYVDRLLAMPAYGERWASMWLDLARYADSQGFANDPDRSIWPYRDWVIQAFNDNMPFDRFTIEQLAGDLLEKPTKSQLVATGFHRNTLTNTEGGTQPEEFRSAAVVDRVNTTTQVWLGLTMACAQCHSHKYDPLTQKEYYQLYAIFNNCEDRNSGDDFPTIVIGSPEQEKQLEEAKTKLADAQKRFQAETTKVDMALVGWEKSVKKDAQPKDVQDILAIAADKRTKQQKDRLLVHHRSLSAEWMKLDKEVKDLTAKLNAIKLPTSPVLKEGKPRPTNIHIRGNYLEKGDLVSVGLPAILPAPPKGEPLNRLTFARWLMSTENPLTARVAVNRWWEELFGIGIVETSEDFGIQGEVPSHPELLDWLASEYVKMGWDTKKFLKMLVMSSTYQQGSQVSEDLAKRDPFNRLLARGPRVRLSAESIRDQALFASGLLSSKMFGPPVQPPRPSFGLSAAFGGSLDWTTSTGEDKYRRGIYTRVRRNSPYPSATTFDAPERTYCNIRRIRTNTPLQALVTLNDPVYVETAQALARRVVGSSNKTTSDRMTYAFRLVLSRPPQEREVKRLTELYEAALAKYKADPAKAMAIATKPLGPAPKEMDVNELAAWTVIGNVLFNLDETLSRR